jgi:hypothetical protein
VVSERSDVRIHPRATLSLSPSAPVVTVFRNGTDQQRQFQLTAKVGGLEGQRASLTWRQVSGPKVLFLSPRKLRDVDISAEQLVQVRTTPRKQRYVFAARVVAQGQVVEKRVSVMTRGGVLLGEVDAATPSEAAIAESTELTPLEGATRVESRHDLRIDGPTVAAVGTHITLRAIGSQAMRGDLRWTIDGTPAGAGRTVQVRAPATPGDTALVDVEAILPSGAVVRAVTEDTLTLAHESAPLAKRLSEQRNIDVIRDALKDALGVDWRVRCEFGVGEPAGDTALPSAPGAGAADTRRAEEDDMIAEVGAVDDAAPRRDPEEVALELLQSELGARRIDG